MPDEEIDKLIKDAANQHHPPYDDKAWARMEVLLNKHLPQKKDKRKYLFYLFTFLLIGAGVYLSIEKTWKNSLADKQPISKKDVLNGTVNPFDKLQVNSTQPTVNKIEEAKPENSIGLNTKVTNLKKSVVNNNNTRNLKNTEDDVNLVKNGNTMLYKNARLKVKIKAAKAVLPGEDYAATQKLKLSTDEEETLTNIDATVNVTADTASSLINNIEKKQRDFINTNDTTEKAKAETETLGPQNNKILTGLNETKKDKGFTSNLGFTVSAGVAVNYIDINSTGKIKPVIGAGLSYAIRKRLVVRSALLISRKVYSATPAQYKFPNGYTNPSLVNIDADCKIYEIPLSVYYKFAQAKKHAWFGSLGISSYLMKTETYDYQYKNAAGQTWNYERYYSNENKHYLSVISLSGGYQYNLSNRINLMVEPFVNVPLSGVGAGKIKLNSAGILFTAELKPFKKK